MKQEYIDDAIDRIGEYINHTHCDSELEASLVCEHSALEIYKTLLFSRGCRNALTETGCMIVEDWIEATINNADELAELHGLTKERDHA